MCLFIINKTLILWDLWNSLGVGVKMKKEEII
jgi:hypothetical protein